MAALDQAQPKSIDAADATDVGASETCPRAKPIAGQRSEFAFLEPARGAGEIGWLGACRVIKVLGQGGMGMVFLAEDTRLGRTVALKVMHVDLAKESASRERFLREARSAAMIRSDHVIAIHEIGFANDLPFIVTELLQGEPLSDWLKKNPQPSVQQVLDIGLQITRGLEACHRAGVIHRDIKPSNIWVETPSGRIKILDFGLARASSGHVELTKSGEILGTPAYMSPEQAEGSPVDERCDLFSLGCVLYQLASGVRPFDGPSAVAVLRAVALDQPAHLASRRPDLPRAFCDLAMHLLAKAAKDRPASTSAVIETLTALGTSPAPVPAALTTLRPQPKPTAHDFSLPPVQQARSRRPRRIAAVVAFLGLASFFGVIALWLMGDDEPTTKEKPEVVKTLAPVKNNGPRAPSAATPGVTDDEILLGMSAPFSGPARELGRAVEVGLQTYFAHINDQGGIARRKIKLVSLDDGYQPDSALANMKDLFERRKAFAVIGNVGTPTAESTMPYALANKRIFFGAFTGAPLLRRDPPDRYVFNVRASYAEETAAIVKYLLEFKGLKPDNIAVFTQQDGYGDAGFEGVVKTFRKLGRKPEHIVRVGHHRNQGDVGDAVREILEHKEIRAVVMVSTYRPAAQFIRQLKDAKADLVFANVSFVGSDALAEDLAEMGPGYAPGVIVSQVVPHPDSQSSLVLKYREHLAKYHPSERPSFGSLEGYINAAVFAEGLKRAGDAPTTESVVDALESIRNLDIGLGTPIHFGPSEHQASHRVWGTIIDAKGRYRILDLE